MKFYKAKRRQKPRKKILQKKRLLFLIALVFFLVVVILGMRSLGSFQALQNKSAWAKALRENPKAAGINYLLYGLIEAEGEIFIDEMFLLNFVSSSEPPHIFFIPGNSLFNRIDEQNDTADSPAGELSTESNLSSYYTPGTFYQSGGAEMLVNQLSSFLGVPVHHFLEIRYDGIPVLIDDRGGISYKGYVLKGDEYLDYFLRSESGEDALNRALRRARSLHSLVEFSSEKRGLWVTPRLLKKISPYMDTDLSWKELQAFYERLKPLFDPNVFVVQLPGVTREINGEHFFEPAQNQVAILMENLGEDFILPRDLITIEVLNGCGIQGIAGKMAEKLRSEGFKIEDENIGNADHFDYSHTRVISRLEDVSAAKQVAEVVSVVDLIKEPVPDYPVMVTVIVGNDFSL